MISLSLSWVWAASSIAGAAHAISALKPWLQAAGLTWEPTGAA